MDDGTVILKLFEEGLSLLLGTVALFENVNVLVLIIYNSS
jgi:hypothetical protein